PITDRVYEHNVTTGVNVTGVNASACRELFGNAAEATQNDGYCRCSNSTVAFLQSNRCYFLVETTTTAIVEQKDCPSNSRKDTLMCKCPVGYEATANKQGCVRKSIYSLNLQSIDPNIFSQCNAPYTEDDCVALHNTGAICRNSSCYCDRSKSFVSNNRCGKFE
ncbi:unnamed protein product, partial [Rotaria sp. Silwood2]